MSMFVREAKFIRDIFGNDLVGKVTRWFDDDNRFTMGKYSSVFLQEDSFIRDILGRDLLDKVTRWISKHVSPSDVYTTLEILEACKDTSQIIEYATDNLAPGEVFSNVDLESWADGEGYVCEYNLEAWAMDNGYIYKDDIADHIPNEFYPDCILGDWAVDNGYIYSSMMDNWAENHGYVKEEDV